MISFANPPLLVPNDHGARVGFGVGTGNIFAPPPPFGNFIRGVQWREADYPKHTAGLIGRFTNRSFSHISDGQQSPTKWPNVAVVSKPQSGYSAYATTPPTNTMRPRTPQTRWAYPRLGNGRVWEFDHFTSKETPNTYGFVYQVYGAYPAVGVFGPGRDNSVGWILSLSSDKVWHFTRELAPFTSEARQTVADTYFILGAWNWLVLRLDPNASEKVTLWSNGHRISWDGSGAPTQCGGTNPRGIFGWSGEINANASAIDTLEMNIYNRALGDVEIDRLHRYFKQRYGGYNGL